MSESTKRKQGQHGSDRPSKKSKGQWHTTARKAKMARLGDRDAILEVGDQGIWVTFARGQDRKAIGEFRRLCDELGKEMYDITPPDEDRRNAPRGQDGGDEDDDEDEGIEASINKELAGFNGKDDSPRDGDDKKSKEKKNFAIVRLDIECVFFVKTRPPVDPIELCRRICRDAKACTNLMTDRKTKYINRLTPVNVMDKVHEKGLERAARAALSPVFALKERSEIEGEDAKAEEPESGDVKGGQDKDEKAAYAYAIRHSIRNNSELKHGDLIQSIAALVDPRHKVDLEKPDKVILVDVFQNFCGFSVVEGSDWDELRKLNVNEVYKLSPGAGGSSSNVTKEPKGAKLSEEAS